MEEDPEPMNTSNTTKTEVIVLHLRPAPGNWRTPPLQRLRAALKVLLRGFGLRAITCRPAEPADETKDKEP